jgi:hypothetical protein
MLPTPQVTPAVFKTSDLVTLTETVFSNRRQRWLPPGACGTVVDVRPNDTYEVRFVEPFVCQVIVLGLRLSPAPARKSR